MRHMDVGHLERHRHQIIRHRTIAQQPVFIVQTFLEHDATDTLNDSPPNLLVYQLRVDDAATVFDAPVIQQLHKAGLDIDFDVRCLDTVRKSKWEPTLGRVSGNHEFGPRVIGQDVGPEIGLSSDFGQRQYVLTRGHVDKVALGDIQLRRGPLDHKGCEFPNIGSQGAARLQDGFASDAGPPGSPGASTVWSSFGIACDDLDLLYVHPNRISGDLGKYGFGTLTLFPDTDMARHDSSGLQAYRGAVQGGNPGPAYTVERGAGIGKLDKHGKAYSPVDVLLAQLGLLTAQGRIVHKLCNFGQRLLMR